MDAIERRCTSLPTTTPSADTRWVMGGIPVSRRRTLAGGSNGRIVLGIEWTSIQDELLMEHCKTHGGECNRGRNVCRDAMRVHMSDTPSAL